MAGCPLVWPFFAGLPTHWVRNDGVSHCFHVANNPVSATTIVLHAAFRLPAGPEPAPPRQRAPAVGEVDALCQTLATQGSLAGSLHQLRVWLQAQTGATQVRIGWYVHGQVRLTTSEPASRSSQDEAWRAAMCEAIDQGMALCAPADTLPHMAEWVTRAQGQLAQLAQSTQPASASSGAQACTLILPATGPHAHPLGAISLVWPAHADSLDATTLEAWQALATRIAPLLAWQQRADQPWWRHLLAALRLAHTRWQSRTATRPWLSASVLSLALLVLLIWPGTDDAGGHARIEGAQQRVLVATTDGFIKQVHAQPGDRVKANQVLADLAEQDLKLEREKWASQAAQQDNAYAAAMTRADRTEAALAMSRLEEAQAQLALVDEQLQRTQLKAPFDGVLIQGDLTQAIGAPVKQGDTLMTVASTSRWRVMIDIDESDVARVHPGQTGAIALSALPWDTLPLRVVRITPIAKQTDGRNVFEVEAEFTAPVPAEVRPGLMGQAKVHVDRTPLIWSWLRPVVNRIRLGAWSWLG